MKKIFFILSILFIAGCSTVEFVRKETGPQKQAVLRYLPSSNTKREAKNRDEINEKAKEFCGSDFKITKEYQAREQTGSSSGVGTGIGMGMGGIFVGGANANTAMYNFVEFSCL